MKVMAEANVHVTDKFGICEEEMVFLLNQTFNKKITITSLISRTGNMPDLIWRS